MLIALTSAKGSPGVTTTALALALCWPRSVVLAELDPAGGDVLAGFGGARLATGGLEDVVFAAHRGSLKPQLQSHLVRLDAAGRARLLPGLADPAAARTVDWDLLAAALADLDADGADVLADCGRLRAENFPTAAVRRAAAVLVVTGSTLRAAHAATSAVAEVRGLLAERGTAARGLAALVVGPGEPYSQTEIAAALGVPAIGALPRDRKAAAVLSDGASAGRLFTQTPLLRASRATAATVADFAAGVRDALERPQMPDRPLRESVLAAPSGGDHDR